MTSASSMATSQRTGRTKRSLGFAPVHVLGPVDGGNFPGQGFTKNFSGGAPFLRDPGRQVFTLCSLFALQLGNLHAGFLGEGVRGGSRLSVFEGHAHGRSGHLLDGVRLRGGNVGRQHSQPARRIEKSQRTRMEAGARGRATCGRARAIQEMQRQSSAPESLRIRSRAENLA